MSPVGRGKSSGVKLPESDETHHDVHEADMRRLYPAECQHCHQRDSEVYEFEGEQSGARLEQGNADIFYAHLACVGPLLLEWRNERDGDYYITLGPERITVLGTKEDAIRTAAAGRGYDEELGL